MVTSVLYDQFRALNSDFHHAVGRGGEFQGSSMRELRRRHQKLTQSVEHADQFMMIANVCGFGLQITNLIFILYCAIFFRDETVGQDAISAVMYAYFVPVLLEAARRTDSSSLVTVAERCTAIQERDVCSNVRLLAGVNVVLPHADRVDGYRNQSHGMYVRMSMHELYRTAGMGKRVRGTTLYQFRQCGIRVPNAYRLHRRTVVCFVTHDCCSRKL